MRGGEKLVPLAAGHEDVENREDDRCVATTDNRCISCSVKLTNVLLHQTEESGNQDANQRDNEAPERPHLNLLHDVVAAALLHRHPQLEAKRHEPEAQVKENVESDRGLVGNVEIRIAPELVEALVVQRRRNDVGELENAVAASLDGLANIDAGESDASVAGSEAVEPLAVVTGNLIPVVAHLQCCVSKPGTRGVYVFFKNCARKKS